MSTYELVKSFPLWNASIKSTDTNQRYEEKTKHIFFIVPEHGYFPIRDISFINGGAAVVLQ